MNANIDKKTRRAVYERDGFRCALCDSTDGIQIHHIKPRGRGGSSHPMNLITLCWRCHAAAHGSFMMLDEYAKERYADHIKGETAAETLKNAVSVDEAIRHMMEDVELACIEYVADLYAEQGEIWYPWDG